KVYRFIPYCLPLVFPFYATFEEYLDSYFNYYQPALSVSKPSIAQAIHHYNGHFKNLQKPDGLIANIFNIMTLGKGHISNVTSLIVKSPYLYMCMRTRIKDEKSFLKSFSLKKASHTRSY